MGKTMSVGPCSCWLDSDYIFQDKGATSSLIRIVGSTHFLFWAASHEIHQKFPSFYWSEKVENN